MERHDDMDSRGNPAPPEAKPDSGATAASGTHRPISDARLAANRRNAQRSTGPRTPEGKQRSSQNATTHGIYATGLNPIMSGPLQEEGSFVNDIVADVLSGLAPETPLECRAALNIAKLYLRLERLDRLEGNLIEGASSFTAEERSSLGDEERHWKDFLLTQDVELAIDPECGDGGEFDYYDMTAFLQASSVRDDVLIASHDPWHPKPSHIENMKNKEMFEDIVEHFWTDGGLTSWLLPIRRRAMAKHLDARGRLAQTASHQALRALDTTSEIASPTSCSRSWACTWPSAQ